MRVVSVSQTVGGGMTCGADWWTGSSNSGAVKEGHVSNIELAQVVAKGKRAASKTQA